MFDVDRDKLWRSLKKASTDLIGVFAIIAMVIVAILGANAVIVWLGPWSIIFILVLVLGLYTIDCYNQDNR